MQRGYSGMLWTEWPMLHFSHQTPFCNMHCSEVFQNSSLYNLNHWMTLNFMVLKYSVLAKILLQCAVEFAPFLLLVNSSGFYAFIAVYVKRAFWFLLFTRCFGLFCYLGVIAKFCIWGLVVNVNYLVSWLGFKLKKVSFFMWTSPRRTRS